MRQHKMFRLAHILPGLHLSICLASYVGIFLKLLYLGMMFTYVLIADLPVSLVAYLTGFTYPLFAVLWIMTVGTVWWYGLGRAAEYVIEWIKDSRGDQSGSLFPPDKRS